VFVFGSLVFLFVGLFGFWYWFLFWFSFLVSQFFSLLAVCFLLIVFVVPAFSLFCFFVFLMVYVSYFLMFLILCFGLVTLV
jgi:hypothetical protein